MLRVPIFIFYPISKNQKGVKLLTPKRSRGIAAYLLIAALLIFLAAYMLPRLNEKEPEYTYSEIISHFDNLEVTGYTLDLGTGDLKLTLEDSSEEVEYSVPNVSIFLNDTKITESSTTKPTPILL